MLAGTILIGRRLRLRRVAMAATATGVVLVTVNLVRLLLIVGSTNRWGMNAFRWSHEVYGSLVSIAGVAVAIALFLKLVGQPSRALPNGG